MTSLLDLPNELLQHTASYLPCSSLFKLIQVNRQLHEVCNDRHVYHLIAKNTLSHDSCAVNRLHKLSSNIESLSLSPSRLAWPEGDALLQGASLATTIRVAYAVEQCTLASYREDDEWTLIMGKEMTLFDISDWLPHMLALHHPAGRGLTSHNFLRVQGELSVPVSDLTRRTFINRILPWSRAAIEDESLEVKQRTVEFINTNFILSYTTLQRLKTHQDTKGVIRMFEDFFFPVWLEGTHPMSWSEEQQIISKTVERLCDRVPGYGQYTNNFTLAQAMAVLPAMIIELAAQFPSLEQLQVLPIPSKIPFHTFMMVPAVFRHTAEDFSTSHIRGMSTPTFLSGRWRGYYSDQRGFLNNRRFDPAMRNISILSRDPSAEEATRMKVQAIIDRRSRGVDSHGEFSLEGRVCENGLVHLVKRYIVMGWSWSWCGQVTPFGIIGVWGGHNNFGGYFWISKEEWSQTL